MQFANLRPMGVGEVLDAAFRLYRTRFKDLIIATAVVVIPVQLLQILVVISIPNETRFETRNGTLYQVQGPSTTVALGAFAAVILLTVVSGALAQGSAIRIIADGYLGTATSWRTSLSYAMNNAHRIIWVSLLSWICIALGTLACILPGVYLYVAFAVIVPVLLVEQTRGTKALGRSRQLVTGRWWPTFGTLLVVWLLTTILTSVAGVLLGVGVFATASGETGAQVANGIAGALISALVTPLTAAVTVIIYFDLRIRKEGFDVALMAQRLGATPPAGGYSVPPGGMAPAGGWGSPTAPYGAPPATPYAPPPASWQPPIAPPPTTPPPGTPPPPPSWQPPIAPPPAPSPPVTEPPAPAPPAPTGGEVWPPAPGNDAPTPPPPDDLMPPSRS